MDYELSFLSTEVKQKVAKKLLRIVENDVAALMRLTSSASSQVHLLVS